MGTCRYEEWSEEGAGKKLKGSRQNGRMYYRDPKPSRIIEGSSNILKMIIAQDALNMPKSKR
jgi:hypothetical protein